MKTKRIYQRPETVVVHVDTTSAILALSIQITGKAGSGVEGLVKKDFIWEDDILEEEESEFDWLR